jgi:hypothetical protein
MDQASEDRHSLFLLLSLLLFLVISAFVRDRHLVEECLLVLSVYVTLVAGVLELSRKKTLRVPGIVIAGFSMIVTLASRLHPSAKITIANWLVMALFLAFVSVALFSYLGQPGSITRGRLYASVSLYLMLAAFYYAIFSLLEAACPRSFVDTLLSGSAEISRHALLYLSLVTLTTLGYGDVLPVSHPARMAAAFEAATGVLYIAITVARLVAAYQSVARE